MRSDRFLVIFIMILMQLLVVCESFVLEPIALSSSYASASTTSFTRLYERPKKLTPAQRIILQQQQQQQKQPPGSTNEPGTDDEALSGYEKLKEVVYRTSDTLRKLGRTEKTDKVYEGYAELSKKQETTPAKRLLQSLELRPPSIKTNAPPASQVSPSKSVFESVKGVVYGAVDGVSNTLLNQGSARGSSAASSPIEKLGLRENFKPAVETEYSPEMLEQIPDLLSNNPVKKAAAKLKLQQLEIQMNAQRNRENIEKNIQSAKETVYSVRDGITETITEISKVPDKVQSVAKTTVDFVENIPVFSQQVVDTITSIPDKVEEKVSEVNDNIDKSVQQTQQFVEDVKAIPTKIKTTADNTKKSIEDTVQTIEEIQYNAKVLVGLEKPKPKPPKVPPPPPKPKTATDVALNVAGNVAKSLGQGTWWITKGVANVTWKVAERGGQALTESAKTKIQELQQQQKSQPPPQASKKQPATPQPPATTTTTTQAAAEVKPPQVPVKPTANASSKVNEKPTTQKSTPTPPPPSPKPTPKKDDDELEREVEEALRLAKEAIREAEVSTPLPPPSTPVASSSPDKSATRKIVNAAEESTKNDEEVPKTQD
jgi:hypothetical protein